jgi:DNA-binding transcriptional MerR regulator
MATHPSPKRAVETPTIPDRLYFKIGDVARILKVEPYVLRFWESQFPQLKPNKSGTGQRLYRKRDVEVAVEIKRLVYGEGYTLSGARHALGQAKRAEPQAAAKADPATQAPTANSAKKHDKVGEIVGRARAELREIAAMLTAPAGSITMSAPVQTIRRKGRPAPVGSASLFDS